MRGVLLDELKTRFSSNRPCLEASAEPVKLSSIMDDILECGVRPATQVEESQRAATSSAEEQLRLYLAQPNIPRTQLPTVWWRDNASFIPQVAVVAR